MSWEGAGEVEYDTTGDLNEQIWLERIDADREQAQLEAEGNAHARRSRQVHALLKSGEVEEATKLCFHGFVGGLTGSCTEGDPRHGEDGCRCFECGAHVTDIGGDVLHVESVLP